MQRSSRQDDKRVAKLKRGLPVWAHARPNLLSFLRERGVRVEATTALLVTDVFDAGEAVGPMCRFTLRNGTEPTATYVAPLGQLHIRRRFSYAKGAFAFSVMQRSQHR